jgi:enoyl-CoA hydratase/carnithine racemase
MTSIDVVQDGRVTTLTINRFERRNALDNSALEDLATALGEIHRNATRVVFVRGAEGTFCAGSDLHALGAGGRDYARKHAALGQRVFGDLERLPALTVALVEGHCLGGGLELALSCDVRLATASSSWGFPEVGLGAIPSWGGTQRLPRFVGLGTAKRLLLTGERVPARDAAALGLVDAVFENAAEMLAEADGLARRAAGFREDAFHLIKELALASFDVPLAQGCWAERAADEVVTAAGAIAPPPGGRSGERA